MNKKNEKGFALILSLVLLLAMSLMSVALILISAEDHKSNNTSDDYQQTFYVAEMALLEGEQYLLNQSMGPWDNLGVRQTNLKNLPENQATVFDGLLTRQNYVTVSVTDDNCFMSFKDIHRPTFRVVIGESWNFGKLLSDSTVTEISTNEQNKLNNYYYEYFITRLGDAMFKGAGTSAKLDAGGTGMNGIAYRVYGCGIFNGPQQIIVSLESVIVLPK